MKKITKILAVFIGLLVVFYACEEEDLGPVLDSNNITAPQFTNPAEGTSFILTKETADSNMTTFQWSAADFGLENLPNITYLLEMDTSGNNFQKAVTLVSSENTTYSITVGTMNSKLLAKQYEPNVMAGMSFRVRASLTDNMDEAMSNILTLSITPYSDVVNVNPIYLLGGGTSAGWNNDADHVVPAVYLPASGADSTFAVVDSLTPAGTGDSDGFIKFVRFIGIWAPQWGSDGAGTWESGNLVYRPTEDVADPTPIPAPDVIDDYLIRVDIVNLTYEIEETVQTLHLIGDATEAGWDNTVAIPMTKEAPGKFSLVTTLDATASEGFKFLEFQGAWEPMIGQDGEGTFETGNLNYRRVGDPDVPSIPPPSETGSYLIEVDIAKGIYTVTPQ